MPPCWGLGEPSVVGHGGLRVRFEEPHARVQDARGADGAIGRAVAGDSPREGPAEGRPSDAVGARTLA